MTAYTLDAHFSYTLTEGEEGIVAFLDAAEEHLTRLDVQDVMIVADEDEQEFTISQLVRSSSGESIETVVGKGMGALRTAFHACEGETGNWPTAREALLYVNVAPVVLRSAEPTPDKNVTEMDLVNA